MVISAHGRGAACFVEGVVMYRIYHVVALFTLAWALNGCGGLPLRSTSGMPEPPAWNSPELINMHTEIVSIETLDES